MTTKPAKQTAETSLKFRSGGRFLLAGLLCIGLAIPAVGLAQNNDLNNDLGSTLSTDDTPVLDWMPDVSISAGDRNITSETQDTPFKILGVGELPQQRLTLTITPPTPAIFSRVQSGNQELEALAAGFWQPGGNNSFFQNAGLQLGWQLELRQEAADPLLIGQPVQSPAPFATIECASGQLTSDSVTASGCRFTSIEQQRLSAVADWSPLAGLHTRLGMFRDDQNISSVPWLLDAAAISSLLPNVAGNRILNEYDATGIQLGVSVQLSAGNLGDLALNADLARVIDYQLSTPLLQQGVALTNLTGPISGNTDLDIAKLQLDWNRGAFSGGVESIYQETPLLPGLSNGNDLTTFNVHFTWHTPWQGSLSIGATNLLDSTLSENDPAVGGDLDSIYGRIPYVRYKQDL